MITTANIPAPRGEVVLFARAGSHRITFTARQLRDTVASYLARKNTMPTPTGINHGTLTSPCISSLRNGSTATSKAGSPELTWCI